MSSTQFNIFWELMWSLFTRNDKMGCFGAYAALLRDEMSKEKIVKYSGKN
jgi:hypothetical protein